MLVVYCQHRMFPSHPRASVARGRALVVVLALLGLALPGPEARAHGTYHDLISLLDQEMARHPEDATIHLRYAALHLEHEDWKSALVSLERARRENIAEAEISMLQGQALAQAGQWAAAQAALDLYLAAHPGNLTALMARARAWTQLKRTDAALADYRLALQSNERQQPEIFIEAAEALWATSQRDEALQVLAAAEAKFGAVPQIVLKAMDWELMTGRHDDALRRIDRMQQSMPRPEPWMLKRASVLAQAGRLAEARTALTRLQAHLSQLPPQQRGSHAMCLIAEQTGTALAALAPHFQNTSPTQAP